jgi:predicted ATPase
VALVLEDLHWGDAPTVRYVDVALSWKDRPIFVLALGRPETEDLFVKLWSRRHVTRVSLPELGKRAAADLARDVLGPAADPKVVERVVERAAGNALHLEELLRAAVERADDAPPDTILAMLAVRLERLEAEARRTLRAGSVFGRTFWSGGVAALLEAEPAWVLRSLRELAAQELVAVRERSDFPGEAEVVFRHALTRDAAYAMLTEADRAHGHLAAGAWLEARGETDAIVCAEHFERGGDGARSATWFLRAAAQAMSGNDFPAAIARADRGLARAEGPLAGEMRLVQAEAHRWRGEPSRAELAAAAAVAALVEGTPAWFTAATELATATAHQGKLADANALLARMLAVAERGPPDDATRLALARGFMLLSQIGGGATAHALAARVEATVPPGAPWDPAVRARLSFGEGIRALGAGDAPAYIAGMNAAQAEFARAGELRAACQTSVNAAYGRMSVGDWAAAERALSEGLVTAERMGLDYVAATARHNLGMALAHLGRFDEALAAESEALRALLAQQSSQIEAAARAYLAEIQRLAGSAHAATEEAERAVDAARARTPNSLPLCLAVLARALLDDGRADDALAAAEEAITALDVTRRTDEAEAMVHVALVEAARATGHHDRALEVLRAARRRLEDRAALMTDPEVRSSFLAHVPDNARLLELSRELGVASSSAAGS